MQLPTERNTALKMSKTMFISHSMNIYWSHTHCWQNIPENCTLLGYNTASSGNPLLMFWDNVSVPSSRVNKSKKSTGLLDPQRWDRYVVPETSVKDYHLKLHYTPEERSSYQHHRGSLKSQNISA
jgi:hypothetical protein